MKSSLIVFVVCAFFVAFLLATGFSAKAQQGANSAPSDGLMAKVEALEKSVNDLTTSLRNEKAERERQEGRLFSSAVMVEQLWVKGSDPNLKRWSKGRDDVPGWFVGMNRVGGPEGTVAVIPDFEFNNDVHGAKRLRLIPRP